MNIFRRILASILRMFGFIGKSSSLLLPESCTESNNIGPYRTKLERKEPISFDDRSEKIDLLMNDIEKLEKSKKKERVKFTYIESNDYCPVCGTCGSLSFTDAKVWMFHPGHRMLIKMTTGEKCQIGENHWHCKCKKCDCDWIWFVPFNGKVKEIYI